MNSRATTISELDALLDKIFLPESYERGLTFQPRPSDIIISPYAKCGTTWLQHISHGLRSNGNLDFDEITAMTPWLEMAYDAGWDLNAEQIAKPRLFKSHLNWHKVPKGARYIVSFRHPYDAMISFYRFFENWMFEADSISLEDFIRWNIPQDKLSEESYWHHLGSWWEQRNNPSVLLLCYEDMKADLAGNVKTIAHFMGLASDENLLKLVAYQSSRDFMLAHKAKFNDIYVRQLAHARAGIPIDSDAHKVTSGDSADRYQLSPELKEWLDSIWQEQIQSRFGFRNYEALRLALQDLKSA